MDIDGRHIDNRDTGAGSHPSRALWLVTQAETNWHAGHRLQGHDGRPRLTVEGYRSAHRCARILAREPIRAVVSSDLRRDVRTAAPIARAAGVIPVGWPDLRERSLGLAEGRMTRDLPVADSGVADGRVVDADAAPPGGETIHRLYDRVTTLLGTILMAGAGDVVVVAHGSVVALALAWLAGLGPDDMAWSPLDSGLIVRREVPVPFAGPLASSAPPHVTAAAS